MSRDTWTGDEWTPMSYNAWLYGYGNPVKYIDHSGKQAKENCLSIKKTGAKNSWLYDSCFAIEWVEENDEDIRQTSRFYGVAPELVAGILAAEIDFDFDLLDLLADQVGYSFYLNYFNCHVLLKDEYRILIETYLLVDNGYGYSQMHYDTWKDISKYFNESNYKLSEKLSSTDTEPIKKFDWVWYTFSNQGAIDNVGAYSRFLADYRKGRNGLPSKQQHFSDLSTTDMAQIFAAYRTGINPITCQGEETCGFRSVDFFQTKPDLGPEAMKSEPYFIYFKNYFSNGY